MNDKRIRLSGSEAKRVYERLIAEGGQKRALGKFIRATSRRGLRPTYTPTLSRSMTTYVRAIVAEGEEEKR